MSVTATEVKRWLKLIGRDRAWLAEKCGVSKGTVNNWLSAGRPITGSALVIIQQMMTRSTPLSPTLDLETYQRLVARAREHGRTIDQEVHAIMREALDADPPESKRASS